MDKTKIEWTDATWNPIRGCSRVSEGCRHCYAETMAARFSGPGMPYEGLAQMTPSGPRWTGEVRLVPEHLEDPLRWKRPRRIFVNSMSDLFHESLTFDQIDRVLDVMVEAGHHTYQILTKRAARAFEYWNRPETERRARETWERCDGGKFPGWPLRQIWMGVSCEDQKTADERIPLLLQTPAAVRFVSCEPLIAPISLPLAYCLNCSTYVGVKLVNNDKDYGCMNCGCYLNSMSPANRPGTFHEVAPLDWVICGGESGPGARPLHPDWARSLRGQCRAAGVAFHFKQWGAWKPICNMPEVEYEALYKPIPKGWPDDSTRDCKVATTLIWPDGSTGYGGQHEGAPHSVFNVGKKKAGRILDGRTWDEFPHRAGEPLLAKSASKSTYIP